MFERSTFSHMAAGFVAVLVGYTSAGAIVYQAALASGVGPEGATSWLWAVGIGMGVTTLGMSWWYKEPLMIAWSTPGAALLITSLPDITAGEAVGVFLFCSALITVCGATGLVDRIMKLIPPSLAAAMLAGVLLSFGLEIFPAFGDNMLLVGAMVGCYVLGRLWGSGFTVPLTFLVGVVVAFAQGSMGAFPAEAFELAVPNLVMPSFSLSSLIGIGVPLFVVTMASQNLPGLAVLRAHGYKTKAAIPITVSGLAGLLLAPFGGYAFNMAAITAALCMGPDVDPKPEQRYKAAMWAGGFYIVVGLFGAAVAAFFAAFPVTMIAAIAGLALLTVIGNSLKAALEEEGEREAAMLCFVITAAGGTFLTISAAFWGLLVGLALHHLLRLRVRRCLARKEAQA